MNELITPSLLWFLIGCFLLLVETLTLGVIISFFGLGVWITD